jgi:hypothetical protein
MKRLMLALALWAALSTSVMAAPVLCSGLGTLEQYIALGDTACSLGDKLFYGFSYVYQHVDNANVPASSVTVTADASNLLNPTLTFSGNWAAIGKVCTDPECTNGGATTTDITIGFTVEAPPQFPMLGASMTVTGAVPYVPGFELPGYVSATESGPPSGSFGSTITYDGRNNPQTLTASTSFPPTTAMQFTKDINLNSGGGSGTSHQSVSLTTITEAFYDSPVPEPSVLLMCGGGLLLISLASSRHVRSRANSERKGRLGAM